MKVMKKIINIIFVLILIKSAYTDETILNAPLTHTTVGTGDQTFYEQVREFNDRLATPSEENVKYISKRIMGISENNFAFAYGSYLNRGAPKLLLVAVLSKKQDDELTKSDYYIVCSLYEKVIFYTNPSVETKVEGWIQGDRRYDVWQKNGDLWKVSMDVAIDNVDVNNLEYNLPTLHSSLEAFNIWSKSIKDQNDLDKDLVEKVKKAMKAN